ncbi:MAG: 50S ribosomal protein L21 [Spirochaetaceae bacterium]
MYALVEIKGKQYKAEEGKTLKVDRIENEAGEKVEFDTVLMTGGADSTKIGSPYVKGAKVEATVEDHGRAKKIKVFKFKRRNGYRRKAGHRQNYSLLKVTGISGA